MGGLALIEQAREAGLKLSAMHGQLVMKGPKRLSSLVSLIAQNKDAVLAALTVAPNDSPTHSHLSSSVGVTETPLNLEETEGFADSVVANRRNSSVPLPWPTQPPDEILAAPVVLCPRCSSRPAGSAIGAGRLAKEGGRESRSNYRARRAPGRP
jgi:hypothetical protein